MLLAWEDDANLAVHMFELGAGKLEIVVPSPDHPAPSRWWRWWISVVAEARHYRSDR